MLNDAYKKEFVDIKVERNNEWRHLAMTLDAKTLMLMRCDCVRDEDLRDEKEVWELLLEQFRVWRRR